MKMPTWPWRIVVVAASISVAHADSVIVDHHGTNDPTTELSAWTKSGGGTVSGGDDGVPHWKIETSAGVNAWYTYNLTDAQVTDPDAWAMTAILKAVDNTEPWNNDIMVEVDDGEDRWHFNFVSSGYSGAGLYRSPGPVQIKAIADIATNYHSYRFVFVRGSGGGLTNPKLNTNDTVDVYVDGVLEATVTRSQALATAGAQTVKFGDNASAGSNAAESRWNFVEFKNLGGGLVSHWTGDNTPNDNAGGNHGTLNGDMTYDADGKIGPAFSLDGSGDYLNVADDDTLDVGANYTKHAWFKADAVSGTDFGVFLQGDDDVQGGNNYLRVTSGSKLSYGVRVSGAVTGPTTLTTGAWYHAVATYNGGALRLYLDGSSEASGTTTIDMNADSRVALGAWIDPTTHGPHSCCYFDGLIDDAALWDDALSAGEVKCLYDVGNDAALAYSASTYDELKQVHDAAAGSTLIDGLLWSYATGLSGSAGLSGSHPGFTLVFDDALAAGSRTGLVSAPVVNGTLVQVR